MDSSLELGDLVVILNDERTESAWKIRRTFTVVHTKVKYKPVTSFPFFSHSVRISPAFELHFDAKDVSKIR